MLLPILAVLALAACGERPEPSGEPTGGGPLTVSAAASLTEALEDYARDFDGGPARYSFAGSDELAAQIRQGAKPDVYAAANTKLPNALAREGLVERPVVFATNRLVLAVPKGSEIRSLRDLERPGVDLVVGSPSVPVGSYTREVLSRLGPESRRILANVRSEEPDVKGVVGKLVQGAADAGFVYASDVTATDGRLEAIALPARLRPEVSYGAVVVKGEGDRRRAQRYVEGLLRGPGARALRERGFGPPPAR